MATVRNILNRHAGANVEIDSSIKRPIHDLLLEVARHKIHRYKIRRNLSAGAHVSMKDDIDPGTGHGKVHKVGEPVAFGNRIFTFKTEGGDTVNMFYRSVSHVMVPQNEAAAERSAYRRLSMVFRH